MLSDVYRVNVVAPLALIQLALPLLAPGARILNVTSDAAVEAYEGWGGYGSSKAALEQLTRVLAAEHPELRIYRVDPGDMNTQMHQEAFPGEDISDRPPPEDSVPGLLALVDGDAAERPLPRVGAARERACVSAAARVRAPARSCATSRPEARGPAATRCGCWSPRAGRRSAHATFADLPDFLEPGDLLVVNTSGTLPAALAAEPRRALRLHAAPRAAGRRARLSGWSSCAAADCATARAVPRRPRRRPASRCPAAARPSSSPRTRPAGGCGSARARPAGAAARLPGRATARPIRYGYVPSALAARRLPDVYATEPGSAEMPSAGRPFTPSRAHAARGRGRRGRAARAAHRRLVARGRRAALSRVVPGAGRDRAARQRRPRRGGRVIAVGTTVVRALETVGRRRTATSRAARGGPSW